MPTPELNNYVLQARAAGQDDAQIRQDLISQGWPADDINSALAGNSAPLAATAPGAGFPWVVVGLVALVLILAGLGYGVYSSRNANQQGAQTGPGNTSQDLASGNNSPSSATQNINASENCGNPYPGVPDTNAELAPFDLSLPDNSIMIGNTNISAPLPGNEYELLTTYYYCTKQSRANVRDFIISSNPEWGFVRPDPEDNFLNYLLQSTKGDGNKTYFLMVQMLDAGNGYTATAVGHYEVK